MKHLKETIIASLKHWRYQAGLTQEELSELITCHYKTYQAYEEGRAQPSVETFIELCEVYHVETINDLIFYNQRTQPGKPISKKEKLHNAYLKAGIQNRKIIDFILNLT